MLLTFYFRFVKKKNTSMLHVQLNGKLIYPVYTKKALNSFSDKLSMKTQPVINQHADVTPGNGACYVNTLSLVERVLSHFLLDPGPMNVTINRQINEFVT